MAGRKSIWTDEMHQYMVNHLNTKTAAQIAMYFGISVSIVAKKRVEYLALNKVDRSEFLTTRKYEKIETKQLGFQRPPAIYSNKSPYCIASAGLHINNQ